LCPGLGAVAPVPGPLGEWSPTLGQLALIGQAVAARQRRYGSALRRSRAVECLNATCLDLLSAGEQLRGGEVESGSQTPEAGVAGVALAGLDVAEPSLVQVGLVGELLLGEPELLTAGFDGQTEGGLKGGRSGHWASLPAARPQHNDIRVDAGSDNPLQSGMTLE